MLKEAYFIVVMGNTSEWYSEEWDHNPSEEEIESFIKKYNGVSAKIEKRYLLKNIPKEGEPMVKIIKEKNGVPTVIEFNGQRYVLDPKNRFKGVKTKDAPAVTKASS